MYMYMYVDKCVYIYVDLKPETMDHSLALRSSFPIPK